MDILVVYYKIIPKDYDFLFEPQLYYRLGYEGGVYTHIINAMLLFIKVKNATSYLVKLSRHLRLNIIMEYNRYSYYIVSLEVESLATYNQRDSNMIPRTSFSID